MAATSRNIIAPAVYVLADFYGLIQIAFSLFLLEGGKKGDHSSREPVFLSPFFSTLTFAGPPLPPSLPVHPH